MLVREALPGGVNTLLEPAFCYGNARAVGASLALTKRS